MLNDKTLHTHCVLFMVGTYFKEGNYKYEFPILVTPTENATDIPDYADESQSQSLLGW